MAGYTESLKKVATAVATKDIIPHLTHYLIQNSEVIASDGNITVGSSFPDHREYMVPADDFDKVIARLGDDSTIEVGEEKITVKNGRYRSTIGVVHELESFNYLRPEGTKVPAPTYFVDGLKTLRPFVSDNATRSFAMAYCITAKDITVTNNIVIARYDEEFPMTVDGVEDILLPLGAADYILSRSDPLEYIQYTANSMSFIFADGSWMRTPLLAEKFPLDQVDHIIGEMDTRTVVQITDEWREAYETVSALTESAIHITPDKITGGRSVTEASAETSSPVEEETIWNAKFLDPVLQEATGWNPGSWPKPAYWVSPKCYGAVMGMRS